MMPRKHFLFGMLLSTVFMLLSHTAFAMRCGNEVIQVGDTKAKVLHYCGKPVSKTKVKRQKKQNISGYTKSKHLTQVKRADRKKRSQEEWVYNFGSNDFLYMLSFEKGRVSYIGTNGHGYN